MIDKKLYRKNFQGGGADLGAGASGAGSGRGMGPAGGASSLGDYGGSSNRPDRDSRDRDAGVTSSAVGTLADPTEKQDYFGSTIFGPSQKYTGSFLDNIFGGGYRNIDPVTGDFQSRFSQAGGLGKSIFGGILGLINPFLGMAYRVGSSLPRFGNYENLADYARGELGLFQKPGINIDKGRGSIINQLYPRENNLGITGLDPYINFKYKDRLRDLAKTNQLQFFENDSNQQNLDDYNEFLIRSGQIGPYDG